MIQSIQIKQINLYFKLVTKSLQYFSLRAAGYPPKIFIFFVNTIKSLPFVSVDNVNNKIGNTFTLKVYKETGQKEPGQEYHWKSSMTSSR